MYVLGGQCKEGENKMPICITERNAEKNCANCVHRVYEADEDEYCCMAEPNWRNEVRWAPKYEKERDGLQKYKEEK